MEKHYKKIKYRLEGQSTRKDFCLMKDCEFPSVSTSIQLVADLQGVSTSALRQHMSQEHVIEFSGGKDAALQLTNFCLICYTWCVTPTSAFASDHSGRSFGTYHTYRHITSPELAVTPAWIWP